MSRRQHSAELVRASAACERCGFRVDGKNAQALAAQHFDKKGHRIAVELTSRITYGGASGKARGGEQRNLL